jgi:putative heme-binding domain-containing protein
MKFRNHGYIRRSAFCTLCMGLPLLGLAGLPVMTGPVQAVSPPQEKSAAQVDAVVALLELVIDADADSAGRCLRVLREKVQSGELAGEQLDSLRQRLDPLLAPALAADPVHPLRGETLLLTAAWGRRESLRAIEGMAADRREPRRAEALQVLVAAEPAQALALAGAVLQDPQESLEFQAQTLDALAGMRSPQTAAVVLAAYAQLEATLKPRAIEMLTQRTTWALSLLQAIEQEKLPADVVNLNQIVRLQSSNDETLQSAVRARWGVVRAERNPQREDVIRDVRKLLQESSGDPQRGWQVFRRVCGQCHRLHGEGQDVGPDLTRNGRGSLEQLLSNVLDPSLVIGPSYQARVVITADGRVLTGLVVEEDTQRLVLKVQGGKLETVLNEDIDEIAVSPVSMMPEGLEKQLPQQELIDLFALLLRDEQPPPPPAADDSRVQP